MVRWPAPPPGDHSPPSSCVSEWAAASAPTYPVNRCGTYLFFGERSSRSAHPLLRALSPLSCGTRDGAPAAGLQLPLATPGGSWRPAQGAEEAGAEPCNWQPSGVIPQRIIKAWLAREDASGTARGV
mmetsp:Transcript_3617/g.5424  ORF Transcript_3617/g.5424 Transcript_3617/m.5424 type:complete len:127 (-) Transcript_3617:48-428(-)